MDGILHGHRRENLKSYIANYVFISVTAEELRYSAAPEPKGCQKPSLSGYWNVVSSVYLGVVNNIVDRPYLLGCHSIPCPVFPAVISVPL
jgi:hypothetical protein